jgi:hypothetical protein
MPNEPAIGLTSTPPSMIGVIARDDYPSLIPTHGVPRNGQPAGKGFQAAIRLKGVILPAPAAIPAAFAYLYDQGGGR